MDTRNTGSSPVRARFDWSETEPSIAIIDAIATLENVDPITLSTTRETTLYDYIDPVALDTVISNDRPTTISFTIEEYLVQVDNEGLVVGYT